MHKVFDLWRIAKTVAGLIFRRPLPGVTVIPLLANGQIVLVRRQDNGLWSLPGGLVDWGETIAATASRELWEETGLDLIEIRKLVGVYSDPDRDPRMHSICITVVADVQGDPEIHDPAEIAEVLAFDPAEIPMSQLAHDHQQQLQDHFDQIDQVVR